MDGEERRFVTNSTDRTLRHFVVPTYPPAVEEGEELVDHDLEPTHRFNDPINKTAWNAVAYSPDAEWLAGGAADPAAHKIYIWDLSNDGQFVSALDGGREPLAHLHWHPIKSIMSTTTIHGTVLLWHSPNPERWGAFSHGFEEVDENVEYEEREDEFDIEDEAVLLERKMKAEEEDVDIDTILVATSPPTGGVAVRPSVSASAMPSRSASRAPQSDTPNAMDVEANDAVSMNNGLGAVEVDTDILWAEESPDDDIPGTWKTAIIMEEDED